MSPDGATLANILQRTISMNRSHYTKSCEYAMQVVKEFRDGLDIQLSPAAYNNLLRVFLRFGKPNRYGILK